MTQAAKAQEPSMEEILASIRRIIADDDGSKARRCCASRQPAPAGRTTAASAAGYARRRCRNSRPRSGDFPARRRRNPRSDRADGTRRCEAAAFAPSSRGRIWCSTRRRPPPNAAATELPAAGRDCCRTGQPPPTMALDELAPVSTVDVARRQFERDTGDDRSLLSTSTTAAVDSAFNSLAQTVLVQNSRTLDDLVREMLRPMLKAWLDDNLPNMVERLVRAEIDRVSRGARLIRIAIAVAVASQKYQPDAQHSATPAMTNIGAAPIAVDRPAPRSRRRPFGQDRAPPRTARPRCRALPATSGSRWSAACCAACRSRDR